MSPGLMFTLVVHTNRRRDRICLSVHCVARGAAKRRAEWPGQGWRPQHGQPAEAPSCGS